MSMDAGFEDLVSQQHRVITRQQALEGGMDKNAIDRRTAPGGRWQRLLPGVYLTVTGTPTQDQREMAGLLYAGPGCTLTGPAALRRHGIRVVQAHLIDVLIPATRVRQSTGFVLIQQTRRLPELVCYRTRPVRVACQGRR